MLDFLLTSLLLAVTGIEGGVLYSHGNSNGDTKATPEDDGSIHINLNTEVRMFSTRYSELYLNSNGLISFTNSFPYYEPEEFPINTGSSLIAGFWADVDITHKGTLFYRETNDANILEQGRDDVQSMFTTCHNDFVPTRAFIATWKSATYFHELDNQSCLYEDPIPAGCVPARRRSLMVNETSRASRGVTAKNNHFQIVLLTDGSSTYVVFNYRRLQWWTGDFSGGSDGAGGNIATVGFCRNDGGKSYTLPLSGSDNIADLLTTTNIGNPGRWVYKISKVNIFDPNCVVLT